MSEEDAVRVQVEGDYPTTANRAACTRYCGFGLLAQNQRVISDQFSACADSILQAFNPDAPLAGNWPACPVAAPIPAIGPNAVQDPNSGLGYRPIKYRP